MNELHKQLSTIRHVSELKLEPPSTAPLDPFKGKPTIRFALSTKAPLTEARIQQIARTLDFDVSGEFELDRGGRGIPLPDRPEVKASLSIMLIPKNKPTGSWLRLDITNAHTATPNAPKQVEIKGDEALPEDLRERIVNLVKALHGRNK